MAEIDRSNTDIPVPFVAEPLPCLSQVDLFQDIPKSEMEELNQMLPLRKVKAGEIIYNPDTSNNALFIIKKGRIRVFQVAASGKALTIAIMEPGSVFGEMLLIGQRMRDSYAEAMESSVVCQLSASDVERYFLSDPRIAVRVSQLLGRRVAELETRLGDMALRPLPQHIASLLLQLATPTTGAWPRHKLTVRLTHEQLASLAGATREAVSKVLLSFAASGLIKQGRGRITVLQPDALRALRNDDPALS